MHIFQGCTDITGFIHHYAFLKVWRSAAGGHGHASRGQASAVRCGTADSFGTRSQSRPIGSDATRGPNWLLWHAWPMKVLAYFTLVAAGSVPVCSVRENPTLKGRRNRGGLIQRWRRRLGYAHVDRQAGVRLGRPTSKYHSNGGKSVYVVHEYGWL